MQSENTLSTETGYQKNRKSNKRKTEFKLKMKRQQKIGLKQRRKSRSSHRVAKQKQKKRRKVRQIQKLKIVRHLAERKKDALLGTVSVFKLINYLSTYMYI
jgi:hypothetical protein